MDLALNEAVICLNFYCILLGLQAVSNISENTLLEYLMINSVFETITQV